MCGISLIVSMKCVKSTLYSSLSYIKHRGSDNTSVYITNDSGNWNIGLGHNRLSIIDLSTQGNQLMFSADGKIVMVFNGQIYNYYDIKKQLTDIKLSYEWYDC
jgi:asparagine synthase (glutamine-hydrolysing)